MKTSASAITSFQGCRVKWDFTDGSRLHLEPLDKALPLWLGTAVHAALEAFYTGETLDPADYLLQYVAELANEQHTTLTEAQREAAQLGAIMMGSYLNEYGARPEEDTWGIRYLTTDEQVSAEQQFSLPIPGTEDGTFVGTIDGFIRDSQHGLWIIDHKTCSQFPNEETLVLDVQFLAYTWAAQRLCNAGALEQLGVTQGERVRGVLYNGLRKQAPGPNVRAALFRRLWVDHSHRELVLFEQRLARLYQEMSDPNLAIYPNPSWRCSSCEFKMPCVAIQQGEDVEFILRAGYQKAVARGEVYETD